MTAHAWPDQDAQPTQPVSGAAQPAVAEPTLVLKGAPEHPSATAPVSWLRDRWRSSSLWPAVPTARRRTLLCVWCLLWVVLSLRGGMYSWHYFVTAGTLAGQSGSTAGWHLFAAHPELQFGPVTVLVARLLTSAGATASYPLAAVVMLAMGGVVGAALCALRQAVGHPDGVSDTRWTVLLLAPAWSVLVLHYGHLDDALALTFASLASVALARGRRTTASVLFALATGAKPWALPMAVAALVLPPWLDRRTRGRRRADWALHLLLVALPWLPFLVAAPETFGLGSFHIDVASDSVLTLFTHATATPSWDRPVQLAVASVIALWCARRGRWIGVPLVVLATRMALDPATYGYYTSGLLVAALLLDAASTRRWRAPAVLGWWLLSLLLDGPMHLPAAAAGGRLVMMVILVATTALAPGERPGRTDDPIHPELTSWSQPRLSRASVRRL